MVQIRVQPWINREDYEEFKRIAPDDPALPAVYDEWLEIAREQEIVFTKSGVPVERVYLNLQELKAYCALCGLNPDGVARASFAVQKHCPIKVNYTAK